MTATVVGESPSNLDQVIEINKGSDDGIEVGMAVIVGAGLVGKITAPVLPDPADVMLLTDSRYAVGVKVVPGAPPDDDDHHGRPRRRRRRSDETDDGDDRAPPATDRADDATRRTSTTTTSRPRRRRSTSPTAARPGSSAARAPDQLPQVDLLADTPVFGRFVDGDIVLTSGGTDGLAPPDIPVGVVRNVISRSSAEGPLLEVEHVRRPRPPALRAHRAVQAGVRDRAAVDTQAGG